MLKKVIRSETSSPKKKNKKRQCFAVITNLRIVGISVFANTIAKVSAVFVGLCLSSMGVVFRQENTSRVFKKYFLCPRKKLFAISFVYFNSWPVILTALPAVMVVSRRCETRS